MYNILFMTQAQKDAKKLSFSGLKEKALKITRIIRNDPFWYPLEYELLKSDVMGLVSRRINK